MPEDYRADLRDRLRVAFSWRGEANYADVSGWWADPALLREIGPALADLHRSSNPTLVAGIEALGFLVGPLVAIELGVGFVAIRKGLRADEIGDDVISRTTPPDYNERGLALGIRRRLVQPKDRVLLVDEWITTGAQATAAKRLIEDAGGDFVGAAVVVDATDNATRRTLDLRSLITLHGLG
jgi:adenine phosphoribosyltransferase